MHQGHMVSQREREREGETDTHPSSQKMNEQQRRPEICKSVMCLLFPISRVLHLFIKYGKHCFWAKKGRRGRDLRQDYQKWYLAKQRTGTTSICPPGFTWLLKNGCVFHCRRRQRGKYNIMSGIGCAPFLGRAIKIQRLKKMAWHESVI